MKASTLSKVKRWKEKENKEFRSVRYHTKRTLAGSDDKDEDGLENAPTDWRLAVDMMRSPAVKQVNKKAAVAKAEITEEITGIVSA